MAVAVAAVAAAVGVAERGRGAPPAFIYSSVQLVRPMQNNQPFAFRQFF